jgi:hypothetical protein
MTSTKENILEFVTKALAFGSTFVVGEKYYE